MFLLSRDDLVTSLTSRPQNLAARDLEGRLGGWWPGGEKGAGRLVEGGPPRNPALGSQWLGSAGLPAVSWRPLPKWAILAEIGRLTWGFFAVSARILELSLVKSCGQASKTAIT